jgi:hypothetical protein
MTPRITAGLVGAAILATGAAGFYWKGRLEGAARERPKVEAALSKAVVAGLEADGERESAVRAEAAVQTRETVVRSIVRVIQEAQRSEDAHAPIDPARLARLRAHDDELCRATPALVGCATTDDAGGSAKAVRAAPAAEQRDRG